LLDVDESLAKHVTKESQKLVNSKVVNLVPMLVKNIQAGLEPSLLAMVAIFSDFISLHAEASHHLGNLE
jgi:hypothetical protein